MVAYSSSPRSYSSWFVTLSLVAVSAAFIVGFVLWHIVELSSISAVSERLDRAKPLLNGLRIGLIALFIVYWVRPLRSDRHATHQITGVRLTALRWRIIGWVLLIELLIGQDLIGRLAKVLAA